MKTFSANPHQVVRDWFVVDATDKNLGRIASRIAYYLRGKYRPEFTPHVDVGAFMIILNAEKIGISGKKRTDKVYYWHTNYPHYL